MFDWENLLLFLRALGDDCAYFVPVLVLLALLNRRVLQWRAANVFFFTAVFWCLGWRMVYALAMRGGSRYFQLPMILLVAIAPAAFPVVYRWLKRFRFRNCAIAGLALLCVGLGIGKALNPPSYKKFIPEMAERLAGETGRGILFDTSAGNERFELLLPKWEIVMASKNPAAFWREFFDFIREKQGQGKPLYLLLRSLKADHGGKSFAAACEREWGMFPFVPLHRMSDSKYDYELFRYTFPDGLFGLPGVTLEQPNPYQLRLPEVLNIQRGKPYTLRFAAIQSGAVLQRWGGIEADVRYGEVDDEGWTITPDGQTPAEFPLAVTLYLPNGWPVGYAACTVRVTEAESDVLPDRIPGDFTLDPSRRPEHWRNCLPAPPQVFMPSGTTGELLTAQLATVPDARCALPEDFAIREVTPTALTRPVFWVGSRGGGTSFVTTWLRKRHPELTVFRLEQYPVLPYSKDPRYGFADLATPREPVNPLLNSENEVDWEGYLRDRQLPDFQRIVLALGFEEVVIQGHRMAFHIDAGMEALRKFLTEVQQTSPACRILIVLPPPPELRAEHYRTFSANPYLYGFRWGKRHSYRRLAEGVTELATEFPGVTVLPTYLLVPAGESERHPQYLSAIESYLQYLESAE